MDGGYGTVVVAYGALVNIVGRFTTLSRFALLGSKTKLGPFTKPNSTMHPLLLGVNSLSGGHLYADNLLGSTVASWNDFSPLIAVRGRLVELNMNPVSSLADAIYGYNVSTDGARLIANALAYIPVSTTTLTLTRMTITQPPLTLPIMTPPTITVTPSTTTTITDNLPTSPTTTTVTATLATSSTTTVSVAVSPTASVQTIDTGATSAMKTVRFLIVSICVVTQD